MDNKELEEFVNSDITPTASLNIIINAVNSALNSGVFDLTDQALIKKALSTIKDKCDSGEDFIIKVK